jgi:predicted DNA binding CopG/RHH family protein
MKKKEPITVTIDFNNKIVAFIKNKAKKIGVPYQTMIKTIIDK